MAESSAATKLYLTSKSKHHGFSVGSGKRPHIFLVTADMISPDCYLPSREMSRHLDLKNIRSIGQEGARFDNALTTTPLCGPARASLFTGTYPPYLTNGERAPMGMKVDLAKEDIIFQEFLRRSGYNTKHVGKCHVGIEKFQDAFRENMDSWDRWAPPLLDDDDYVKFLKEKRVKPPVYKKELRGLQADRKNPGNSLGGWIQQGNGKPFPLEAQYSMYLAEKALDKMDAALEQNPSGPLYIELDFFDPHQPFSIPAGFEKRAEQLRKLDKLPESYNRIKQNNFQPQEDEPEIYPLYRRYWGAYDAQLVKDYRVANFLQMEVVDKAVGKLLNGIKERGLWDDSVVIFCGDHGEMNGRLGMFDKGVYFQPDIFRIPLYIKLPQHMKQQRNEFQEPVSIMDISQTILDCAQIKAPTHTDGKSLLPILKRTGKRHKLTQLFQTGWHIGVNYGVGIHLYDDPKHHWFYGYNIATGKEELYNMTVDDSVNLIDNPAYKAIHQNAVLKMAELLQQDRRWLGYWSTFRLHKPEMLPRSEEDMQMFVPKKD